MAAHERSNVQEHSVGTVESARVEKGSEELNLRGMRPNRKQRKLRALEAAAKGAGRQSASTSSYTLGVWK